MTTANMAKFSKLIFSIRKLLNAEKESNGRNILGRTEEQKAYSSMIYELEQKLNASMNANIQSWDDAHPEDDE